MSNILYGYHIKKEKENNKYDNFFKAKINGELENSPSKNELSVSSMFSLMKSMLKQLLRVSIKILLLVLIK